MKNGYVLECDFCGAKAMDDADAHRRGWDWFTGWRRATFHACGHCRKTRADEFQAAFADSRKVPSPKNQISRFSKTENRHTT